MVCNSNGVVFKLSLEASGNLIVAWLTDLSGEIYSSPALKDNTIVVSTMKGFVVGLDYKTGDVLYNVSIQEYSTSSPIITKDNVVVTANSKGRVIALDLFSGRILGVLSVTEKDKNINSSPIHLSDGNIVVGGYDGFLYKVPMSLILQSNDKLSPLQAITLSDATNIELISQPHSFIHSFRLITSYPNASINPNTLRVRSVNTDEKIPYEVKLSPDGTCINFLPKTMNISDMQVTVNGTFYLSRNWVADRFNFIDVGSFSKTIQLPGQGDHDESNVSYLEPLMSLNICGLAVSQPIILDTYIPAAMDGQGFISYITSINKENKTFTAVFFPAIPDQDHPFEIIKEPSKVLSLYGCYEGNRLSMCSLTPFTFSAMGGTITFSDFRLYGVLNSRKEVDNIDFYAKANCLKIKGNGKHYKFSQEVVQQLCDRKLDVHVVGTAKSFVARPIQYSNAPFLVVHYNPIVNMTSAYLSPTLPSPSTKECASITFVDGVILPGSDVGTACWKPSRLESNMVSSDSFWVNNIFPSLLCFSNKMGHLIPSPP